MYRIRPGGGELRGFVARNKIFVTTCLYCSSCADFNHISIIYGCSCVVSTQVFVGVKKGCVIKFGKSSEKRFYLLLDFRVRDEHKFKGLSKRFNFIKVESWRGCDLLLADSMTVRMKRLNKWPILVHSIVRIV